MSKAYDSVVRELPLQASVRLGLEEGFADKPSDLDIVYIYGYGWPPAKGGPMFYAENYIGLPKLLERLKHYDAEAKNRAAANKNYRAVDYFTPSKLLEECVAAKQPIDVVLRAKAKAAGAKL